MVPHDPVDPHDPSKPTLRKGRLLVAMGDGGPKTKGKFIETVTKPEFDMVPGDGRIPYVDLEGDRSVQVAFRPDGVRVLMDDVCASVLTDGTIACSVGETTVTMIDGSVRVAHGNGAIVMIASADLRTKGAGPKDARDGLDTETDRIQTTSETPNEPRGQPSYTLDEFSNDHLVDDGGRLRRPTTAENAMIVDGIVKFLSRFGIRDTTSIPRLGVEGHSTCDVSTTSQPPAS